jgi:hypothetical protein
MQGFEFGTNTLDTIIPMDWEPFADANGMNTRAGKLGGIRSGRSYVISQCVTIVFSFVLHLTCKQQISPRRSLYPAPPTRPPTFFDQHLEYTTKRYGAMGDG